MDIDGNGLDLFGLYGLGILIALFTTLFSAGAFIRTKSVQSAPALQTPVFLILFLAPVYVPLNLLTGWIEVLAKINPATALVQSGRGFMAGIDLGEHDPALPGEPIAL